MSLSLDSKENSGFIQDCLCPHRWGEVTARTMQVGSPLCRAELSLHWVVFFQMRDLTVNSVLFVCPTLPQSRSASWWGSSEDGLQQHEPQMGNRCWGEVLSPWKCRRTEVEAEAGDRAFSCLLLQWNHHSLPNSITFVQEDSGTVVSS